MTSLQIKNLGKRFGAHPVLDNIDIDISSHELVVLVGPSGCGKSTLLRIISGLEDFTSGDLFFDGQDVRHLSPKQRGIAIVFQSYALYPHMTVFENMAFGLSNAGETKSVIKSRIAGVAASLELETLLDRLPRQLSGGQRQRVAIGRALVRNPRVFLFDEPLSNLDAALRGQTRLEIAKLHQQLSATMIYVTHDQAEAMTLADKIVVMNRGRIEQIGRPMDLYHRPANLFVATFLGSPKMNILNSRIAGELGEQLKLSISGHEFLTPRKVKVQPDDRSVNFGIRPEDIQVSSSQGVPGEVEIVEEVGDHHLIHFKLSDGQRVVYKGTGSSRYSAGQRETLGFNVAASHYFDQTSGCAI